jgi:hypothetical protein
VAILVRASVCAFFGLFGLVVSLSATPGAAPQEPPSLPPVSLERIREGLEKTPERSLKFDAHMPPVVTFKSRVDKRAFVLSLEEQLRKDFTLNLLQRQSAEWSSKCCGINLNQVFTSVEKALQRRQLRKIREQIARELAELEAARKK